MIYFIKSAIYRISFSRNLFVWATINTPYLKETHFMTAQAITMSTFQPALTGVVNSYAGGTHPAADTNLFTGTQNGITFGPKTDMIAVPSPLVWQLELPGGGVDVSTSQFETSAGYVSAQRTFIETQLRQAGVLSASLGAGWSLAVAQDVAAKAHLAKKLKCEEEAVSGYILAGGLIVMCGLPGSISEAVLCFERGATIDINDDGTVVIGATDQESGNKAVREVKRCTATPEAGKYYKGKVVRIADFGAFVEIFPKKDGLLHISQIDKERIKQVSDVLSVGDEVVVKVIEIDKESGKIRLSRKDAFGHENETEEI